MSVALPTRFRRGSVQASWSAATRVQLKETSFQLIFLLEDFACGLVVDAIQSNDHCVDILDHVLDLSKLEAGMLVNFTSLLSFSENQLSVIFWKILESCFQGQQTESNHCTASAPHNEHEWTCRIAHRINTYQELTHNQHTQSTSWMRGRKGKCTRQWEFSQGNSPTSWNKGWKVGGTNIWAPHLWPFFPTPTNAPFSRVLQGE